MDEKQKALENAKDLNENIQKLVDMVQGLVGEVTKQKQQLGALALIIEDIVKKSGYTPVEETK